MILNQWRRTVLSVGFNLLSACLLLTSGILLGQYAPIRGNEGRNFDARETHNSDNRAPQRNGQIQALEYAREAMPNLTARFDEATGVTRTLMNRGGYLTKGEFRATVHDLVIGFVSSNATALGLTSDDVFEYRIDAETYTKATGSSRVFIQQMKDGIPVYNGFIQVNTNRDGRIISVNNSFMPDLTNSRSAIVPKQDAVQAVAAAARHLGYNGTTPPRAVTRPTGAQQEVRIEHPLLTEKAITARLVYLPIRNGDARLAWNFQIETLDHQHWYDMTVDAVTGQVWTRFDWVASENYRVYEQPVESPIHTAPAPPADARTLAVNPANATASPNGWHDTGTTQYTITRGNNANAYEDGNNSNSAGLQPNGGASLVFDFAMDLSQGPNTYESAAVTNLFYWNNIIHDITYMHGFDEANGNFQTNNFGLGGNGNDEVQAEAQDGGGTNNANFATPPDGSKPRMQMYLWTTVTPNRDGDFDSGIVVHEYGHGISNRLVGGPNNTSCLGNSQQPGEGWSDWFALAYTAEPGDAGTDRRGVGTYALGEAPDGDGIRTQPYSTDPAINTHTYASVVSKAVPHGVGEVWAQGIWECYWALVNKWGFDPNLYDPFGGAGNQRMILYVVEGMKNTACSPTFVDCRDGIIQAATDNYGGEDVCTLWEAFGAFGLGIDAVSGGSNSTNPTNGFDIPLECKCQPAPIADAGPDQIICLGTATTIGTPAQPDNSYSWSPGGQTTAQITVSPSVATTYTLTATTSCGTKTDSVTIVVDDGSNGAGMNEDFEGNTSGWTTSGLWHLTNNSTCASPGYSSATHAFYYGQDSTCNYSTGAATSGSLTSPDIYGIDSSSTLSFDYYRVVESFSGSYDKTEVAVLQGSSATTIWSLNSSNASTAAWQSASNIDLSPWAGQVIKLRFSFDSVDSVSNTFTGWYVDDVVVTGSSNCGTGNTAPSATITAPANGTTIDEGTSLNFTGTATDAEDGDLTAAISWSSSIDGNLGSGGTASAILSVGTHSITASVSDSGGLNGSDSITVTVNSVSSNTAPLVTITGPADGTSVTDGTSLTFTGTAIDAEDGNISTSISWSSSIDGNLGSGASVSATLSVGTHSISASATDSGALNGSDSISVTVTPSSTWTTINSNDFEGGWGIWIDGGTDARRSINDAAFAHQGSYCIRLRDDTGITSSMYTGSINLSAYTEARIEFWYIASSFEAGEDIFVEYSTNGGSTWSVIANYVVGVDFVNGTFENPVIEIPASSANAAFRIRSDASGNADLVYIDEVVISAR